jgi:hypothetical protein
MFGPNLAQHCLYQKNSKNVLPTFVMEFKLNIFEMCIKISLIEKVNFNFSPHYRIHDFNEIK